MDYEQYLIPLENKIISEKSSENSVAMERYMRNKFKFLGLKKTIIDALSKEFIKENPFKEINKLSGLIDFLWQKEAREYQYIALKFLEIYQKILPKKYIEVYEKLIQEKSWWDTIDVLATRLLGNHFKKFSEQQKTYPEKWINSENIWLQRTAILYQLKYKENTNQEQLFSFIQKKSNSEEFFVQKAIGWALREYSKTSKEEVLSFVQENELASLSKREALKWLNKQEK